MLYEDIIRKVSELNVDDSSLSLKYEVLKTSEKENSYVLSVGVRIINKATSEELVIPIPVLEIPIKTQLGYNINGTNYTETALDKRASGWFITNQNKKLILELLLDMGSKTVIEEKYTELLITIGKNNKSIPLAHFLKAATGKSYKDLIRLLGPRNKYILSSFVNEPTRDEALSNVLRAIKKGSYRGGFRLKSLEVFIEQALNTSSCKDRTIRNTSFTARLVDRVLGKKVLDYNAGETITKEMAQKIDESGIDTIFVRYNNKFYELKKYSIDETTNFVDELIIMTNMYALALDGYNSFDNRYELYNRRTISFEDKVCNMIASRCNYITSLVKTAFAEGTSLLNLDLPHFDTKELINSMKSGASDSQLTETTNIVSILSKEEKVSSDYNGRGSEELIQVKESELGLYDPYHQPESNKVGFVHYLSINSVKDTDGIFKGKFIKIQNGQAVSEKPVLLSSHEISNSLIAPWDEDITKDKIKCYINGRLTLVNRDEVEYQEYNCLNNLSLSTALIPFMENSNGKRIVMSDNQIKQAVPTLKRSRAFVSTGIMGLMDKGVLRAEEVLGKYYIENHSLMTLSYEEFIKLPIKLETTDVANVTVRTLIFTVNDGSEERNIMSVIPYNQRTIENTVCSYNIRPVEGYVYQGRDIVAYDHTLDITEYDFDKFINLGYHELEDESVLNTDIALGNSFLMCYKTFSSTTLDDGITINYDLLGTGMLAHVGIFEVKVELKDLEDGVESFGFKNERPDFEGGLPKVGTYLKPKSVAIGKYITSPKGVTDTSKRLDAATEGEVIYSSVMPNGKEAVVLLASLQDAGIGDKLSGSHGNKGVIANIVPASHMPYRKNGERIQIILNPLGIPSRMNISQLKEGELGEALYKKGKNKRIIMTPQYPNSNDVVKKYKEEFDVYPEYLTDGRTGRDFDRPTNVVRLYFKKLKHFSSSKSNATGINTNVNEVTLQSKKGKKNAGGQTMGEMENWSLYAAGCTNLIQDYSSVLSDDISSKKKIKRALDDGSTDTEEIFSQVRRNNKNDQIITILSRAMGVELSNDTNGYKISPLTDKVTRTFSSRPVEGNKEALHDSSIFGIAKDPALASKARGKFGYMELNTEIIHPTWIYKSPVPKFLIVEKLKPKNEYENSSTIDSLSNDSLRNLINHLGGKNKGYLSFRLGKVYYSETNTIVGHDWERGMSSIVKLFKHCKLETALSFYQSKIDSLIEKGSIANDSGQDKMYQYNQYIDSIKSFMDSGFELSDFIISCIPIIPKNFRTSIRGTSDFDQHYISIQSLASKCKSVDESDKLFRTVVAYLGLDINIKHFKDLKNILSYFTGKNMDNSDGYLRDKTLSKVVDISFRAVIVPAEVGTIKLTEVGIPLKLGMEALKDFIKPILCKEYDVIEEGCSNDKFYMNNLYSIILSRDLFTLGKLLGTVDKTQAEKELDKILSLITDCIESYPVIIGRQPTLHLYGMRCFMPKIVDGLSVRLHPLVCTGFNADFDGDQTHGEFIVNPASQKEALENLSPTRDMINIKDNSFILSPTQDTVLGTYIATMLYENRTTIDDCELYTLDNVVFYNNINQLEQDLLNKTVLYQQLVCYKHTNGNKYVSTAGRVLFNSLLPEGFTDNEFTNCLDIKFLDKSNYKELLFDGLIKGKGTAPLKCYSLSKVTNYLFDKLDGEGVCDVLDKILLFGTRASDYSGITLSTGDFIEHPQIDEYVGKANKLVEKINDYYKMGLVSEQDRKDNSEKIYKHISNKIKGSLLDYYDRNNNLFIIMDSGARGNISQLMQSCGLIGSISKSSSESLETPILTNYSRGLSSSDHMLLSYGSRMGISAVQNDTALAGALTRESVYLQSGIEVIEHDCGNNDATFEVMYSDEIISIKLEGQDIDLQDLLNLKILERDINYQKYQNISSGVIDTTIIYYIRKNNIREIETEKGLVTIKYKLSDLFEDLMENRVARNLPGLKSNGVTSEYGIITKETIKHIERNNLITIDARTMLSCKSIGGVCAKCFGLNVSTKKYPPIGYKVGIRSAQAVDESATQLNMDRINKGGLAESNMSLGVNTFKSYSKGSVPGTLEERSIVARFDGYVHVNVLGDYTILDCEYDRYKVKTSMVRVKDGEYVHAGDEIAEGFLNINDIKLDDPEEQLRKRQIELLKIFHKIFKSNSLDIRARNFEVIVRAQLSIVEIIQSNNPNLVAGRSYFLSEINKDDLKDCMYRVKVTKARDVMTKYSGFLTTLSYQSFAENVANISVIKDMKLNSKPKFLGSLLVGESLVGGEMKKLDRFKHKSITNVVESEEEELITEIKPTEDMDNLNDLFANLNNFSLEETFQEAAVEVDIEDDDDDDIVIENKPTDRLSIFSRG